MKAAFRSWSTWFLVMVFLGMSICFIPSCVSSDAGARGNSDTASANLGTPAKTPAAPGPTPSASPARSMDELVDSGNYKEALVVLDSGRTEGIEGNDRHLVKAHLLLGTGDFAGARTEYNAVVTADANNTDALYGLALLDQQSGNLKSSREILDRLLKIDPEYPEAWALLGDLALAGQNSALAEKDYRKSLSLDNAQLGPLLGLAGILVSKGKGKQALDYLDAAARIAPDDAVVFSQRGKVLEQEGDIDLALEDLDKAVSLDPENLWNYFDRGRIHFRAGKTAEAASDFHKVLELDPRFFMARYYLGQTFLSQENLKDALVEFRSALELKPDYTDVFEPMGLALFGLGQYAESARCFEKSFDPGKKNERNLLMAATGYLLTNDPKALKDAFNRYAMLMDRDGMFYSLLRFDLEPSMEGLVLQMLDKTKDKKVKAVYGLYASFPLARLNRKMAVIQLLQSARDEAPAGSMESRIARWTMKNYEQQ